MGSNTSKSSEAASTMNNNSDVCDNTDPRSPTPEIARTPLQNKTGAKHKITKNVDLRKTFENTKDEEKLIHNNPILSAVIKNHLQSYDPRSPTQDFDRTPIIISKTDNLSNGKKNLRLQQNNCGSPVLKADKEECDTDTGDFERSPDLIVSRNLCEGFFNVTLDDTLKETEQPLCSSTASNEVIENNISKEVEDKPTALLETNFDYVASDHSGFDDSVTNSASTAVCDKANESDMKHIPMFKILNVDPRSPSIGIERTPIVVAKTEDSCEENVENMSDDSLIQALQNANVELRQTVNKPQTNSAELLVYEDDSANIDDTPRKVKSGSINGSRTPLSCMKNKGDVGHTRSKSANTVYDPKNQNSLNKVPKRVSHIPRLKCLSKQTKLMPAMSSVSLKNMSKTVAVSGDCENTPPHSHRDRWDKDSSIVL